MGPVLRSPARQVQPRKQTDLCTATNGNLYQ
jgi:hypothetical protein